MYITDIDEVVSLLREKLPEYLSLKSNNKIDVYKKFTCFAHDDTNPSMSLNPKTDYQSVKCFSCGYYGDIFSVANHFDNLPTNGAEWLTVTIPALCDMLDIPYSPGALTPQQKERISLYKLAEDISNILASQKMSDNEYIKQRNWVQPYVGLGSIDQEVLIEKLLDLGWSSTFINDSSFIRTKYQSFFGQDKVTWPIKDHLKRTIGFICRNNLVNENPKIPKYVNSPENDLYKKSKALMGIDIAYKDAKNYGLYIVEGPGDLMQLYRLGIKNAVAVCGTAFTEQHLLYLKQIGIKKIYLCFDWDQAGFAATHRVLENILKITSGINAYVVEGPGDNIKDPDAFLVDKDKPDYFHNLTRLTAFQWQLNSFSQNETPDYICQKMIPIIASEETAVKRDLLVKELAQHTSVSTSSIHSDVNSIRNNRFSERLDRIKTVSESHLRNVIEDPDNVRTHIASYEQSLDYIEKEFKTDTIGINYQVSRFDAMQELRALANEDENSTSFKMNYFKDFANNMNGGMSWASGALMYVGGRANSGKTATCLMIATDIAMSDENATVIIHSTDDSYEQIEPRIKTNIYRMAYPDGLSLSIGMVVQPNLHLKDLPEEYTEAHREANRIFKELIETERLVIIDSEDGATLSTLERNVKHYRMRFPNRKILMVCDNTHNYLDFMNLEQSSRMTSISNQQKNLTVKYHAAMIATAEYRKNMPKDNSKLSLPVDDDLADARALMYRPNVIWHVYNDMHDRKQHAEIFWRDEEDNIRPRLLLHFTKNKISGFKDKLILDLDPKTVSLKPVSVEDATEESIRFQDLKDSGQVRTDGRKVIYLESDEYEDG